MSVSEGDGDQTAVKKIIHRAGAVSAVEAGNGIGASLVNVLVALAGNQRAEAGGENNAHIHEQPVSLRVEHERSATRPDS